MILSDRDGTPEVVDEPAWVLVYILDDDGTAFQYHAASVPDPCSDKPTPPTIVFPYDRYAAIQYAIANSYQNEVAPPPIKLTTQRLRPSVSFPVGIAINDISYAHFVNDEIDHTGLNTGSAAFLSQSIWMGGLPMTWDLTHTPGQNTSCTATSNDEDAGWRFCVHFNSWGGNRVWQNHHWLIPYYTHVLLPQPSLTTPTPLGNSPNFPPLILNDTSIGYAIPDPYYDSLHNRYIAVRTIPVSDFSSILSVTLGDVTNESVLADIIKFYLVSPADLGLVQYGDYVWIDTGKTTTTLKDDRTHGLLIAGWGNAKDCEEVLHPTTGQPVVLDNVSLFGTYEAGVSYYAGNGIDFYAVPYVIDFSWKLQQPIPRPFYCTRFDAEHYFGNPFDPNYNDGYNDGTTWNWEVFDYTHSWYFFALPSNVSLQTERLYYDQDWQWSANDGLIP